MDFTLHQSMADKYLAGFLRVYSAIGNTSIIDNNQPEQGNLFFGNDFPSFFSPVGIRIGMGAKIFAYLFQPFRINICHCSSEKPAGFDKLGRYNPVAGTVKKTGSWKYHCLLTFCSSENIFFFFKGNVGKIP